MLRVAEGTSSASSPSNPTKNRQDNAISGDLSVRSGTATGLSGTKAFRMKRRACIPTIKHLFRLCMFRAGASSQTCSKEKGCQLAS